MDIEGMIVSGESPVLTCQVTDCSYNESEICHAGTISVGDNHPQCDTYTHGNVPQRDVEPCVDTCKVSACFFNTDSACHAAGITVAQHEGHADCLTVRMSM